MKNMCFNSHTNAINVSINIYVTACSVVRVLTSRLYVPKVMIFWLLVHFFARIFV